jgi:hypothetical protein
MNAVPRKSISFDHLCMSAALRKFIVVLLCGFALCTDCVLAQAPGVVRGAGSHELLAQLSVDADAEAEAVARGNERNRALLNEGSPNTADTDANSSGASSASSGRGSTNTSSALTLRGVKPSPVRDAVAIVIGIQSYKYLPPARYASADAKKFSEYARHILGVAPNRMRLLTDAGADTTEITRAFRQWLRRNVNRGTTDVYVFYSGHGLPSDDGKTLYLLPHNTDRDFVDKTGISQQELVELISLARPKSATLFFDSCYSGQSRSGESLLPDARPLSLRSSVSGYPPEFSMLSASSVNQISWSSPELGHGLFSYYLMRGLQGSADLDSNGDITLGEMQRYLVENVARQAAMRNREQEPQLIGDENKILVKR